MADFRRLFAAAAFAALVAGLVLTALQQFGVVPAILTAERYEAAAHDGHAHDHDAAEPWAPADGLERQAYTAAANLVIALGFALLLAAAMHLRGREPGWRSGLAWGAAGFAIFYFAPTLGLPPELPGTEAAALAERQLWWIGTVVATAAGLALLAFAPRWPLRLLGLPLLVLPHLFGAPGPEQPGALAPAELIAGFQVSAFATNAVFWLVLGASYGLFHSRLAAR